MAVLQTESKVVTATAQNLNGAANTALLTYVASKPIELRRFSVMADSANGLLAPMRLKLRHIPASTGTPADIAEAGILDPGGALGQGQGVHKPVEDRIRIPAGDTVTVAVSTAAGGTSTGNVALEFMELPFSGELVDAFTESA